MKIETTSVVTYAILFAFGVVVIVGGIVVIFGSAHGGDGLTFEAYLKDVAEFAIGLGLVGVGRGIAAHGRTARHTR